MLASFFDFCRWLFLASVLEAFALPHQTSLVHWFHPDHLQNRLCQAHQYFRHDCVLISARQCFLRFQNLFEQMTFQALALTFLQLFLVARVAHGTSAFVALGLLFRVLEFFPQSLK